MSERPSPSTEQVKQQSIEAHLRTHVAPRFEHLVADAAERLEAGREELADLRAARASITWQVEGPDGGTWYLNISNGAMTVDATPIETPFMHVRQSRADWERFASGAATPGLLGGGRRRGLGKTRIHRLRNINGTVGFKITGVAGGGDWSFVTHFGPDPLPPRPQTTVTLDAAVAQQIQAGEINPQLAFMQGRLRIEGDTGLAMRLGMALLA